MDHDTAKSHSVQTENLDKSEAGVATNGYGAHAGRPSFGTRVKNHYKRFWWLHLIIFIIILLVILLPIIFVGIPNIAQNDVNKSTLDITEQDATDPAANSLHLKLTSVAKSNSSFHPELDGFRAALFLENTEPDIKPFGYINIPASKADVSSTIIVDQQLDVADMDQFKAYNKLVLLSQEFRIGVRGRTGLKLKGFRKFDVDYNKAVTMKGLNGLNGFAITNYSIVLTPQPDGSNLVGQVFIPNPSVLTIAMGNVTMDLSVDGKPIGNSTLPNLTLKPGDNSNVPMRSILDQSAVIGLITSKYKNGILPIDITGKSSVNSAGEHLTYYENAIAANTLHIQLDAGKALQAIGLNITSS